MYISSYKIFFNCIILYDIKIKFGARSEIRTPDPTIKSRML